MFNVLIKYWSDTAQLGQRLMIYWASLKPYIFSLKKILYYVASMFWASGLVMIIKLLLISLETFLCKVLCLPRCAKLVNKLQLDVILRT